jgi:phosphate transport system permease protein
VLTLTAAASALVVALLVLLAYQVFSSSRLAFHHFGLGFLIDGTWDQFRQHYGALDLILGTLVTSLLALLLAAPIAIASALFLTELAPRVLRVPLGALIEMLAAIPSVVLGLWGIFVLNPFVARTLGPAIQSVFGWIPVFGGPITANGSGVLSAVLILTIMVVPIVASVSRELFSSVAPELKEGALALGATRWEMVRGVLLPAARPGILAALALGFGRAVGEAIAVTQVIGGGLHMHLSLFSTGDTLASRIASQYQGASTNLQTSSLIYLAAILLVISLVVNAAAQLLVRPIDARPKRRRLALAKILDAQGMSAD